MPDFTTDIRKLKTSTLRTYVNYFTTLMDEVFVQGQQMSEDGANIDIADFKSAITDMEKLISQMSKELNRRTTNTTNTIIFTFAKRTN